MKHLFKKFIKNKYFIIWILFFILILFIIFNPLMQSKTNYMEIKKITDYKYLFYVFLLPMSFYDMGFASCIFLELTFFSILSYVSVSFVNLFFKETPTVTLLRLGRKKWIKDVTNLSLKYSIVISILYILFFYILCIKNDIVIDITLTMLIPMIYKILITCIIPIVFIDVFIETNNEYFSILISIVTSLFLQLIIRINFVEKTLEFKNNLTIITIFIILYYLMKKVSINIFKRRDV